MNFDCLTLIFDQLPSDDLVSLAELNKKLAEVVESVFKRRFASNWLVFKSSYYTGSNKLNDRDEISNFSRIIEFPKKYGQSITKLEIMDHRFWPEEDAIQLYREVNLHCSETLKKLHILNDDLDIFAGISLPFQNIDEVSLRGWFRRVDNSDLAFGQIFPALKKLELDMNIHMVPIYYQVLENLEHLICQCDEDYKISYLKIMIRRNTHIKKLTLKYVRPEFLKFVSETLPDIEYLDIGEFLEHNSLGVNNFQFHFERLKSLIVRGHNNERNIQIQYANRLIANSPQLINVDLYFTSNRDIDSMINEQFSNDWNITSYDHYFSLRRTLN